MEDQAVAEHRSEHGADVVGEHVLAPVGRGEHARRAQQRDRRARRTTGGTRRVVPARLTRSTM